MRICKVHGIQILKTGQNEIGYPCHQLPSSEEIWIRIVMLVKTDVHQCSSNNIELEQYTKNTRVCTPRILILKPCQNRLLKTTVSTSFKFAKATSVSTAANAIIVSPSAIIKPEHQKKGISIKKSDTRPIYTNYTSTAATSQQQNCCHILGILPLDDANWVLPCAQEKPGEPGSELRGRFLAKG
ncbi:hypothetical protein U0070_002475 [Myodes glareolus]|uniref:Uncharacterized protein n=1 Tax=Myodes glareolus TaxID=447135 RepID=A0AAW0H458_MYOGA